MHVAVWGCYLSACTAILMAVQVLYFFLFKVLVRRVSTKSVARPAVKYEHSNSETHPQRSNFDHLSVGQVAHNLPPGLPGSTVSISLAGA